jgi:SNF2 family DNA or RNA helicase
MPNVGAGAALYQMGGIPDPTFPTWNQYPRTMQQPSPSLAAQRPGMYMNGYPQSLNLGDMDRTQDGYARPARLSEIIRRANAYNPNQDLQPGDIGYNMSQPLRDYMNDVAEDPRKTQEEIEQLLSNIRPDMDIPEEDRDGTPEAMRYSLMAHQKVALTWMKKAEESNNKGGILADAMGLGKTISTLALMVSSPGSGATKVSLGLSPRL